MVQSEKKYKVSIFFTWKITSLFKCLVKKKWIHNGCQLRLFLLGVGWGWVKWKMTDAILFPHMMSTIKSLVHRALQVVTHPGR